MIFLDNYFPNYSISLAECTEGNEQLFDFNDNHFLVPLATDVLDNNVRTNAVFNGSGSYEYFAAGSEMHVMLAYPDNYDVMVTSIDFLVNVAGDDEVMLRVDREIRDAIEEAYEVC